MSFESYKTVRQQFIDHWNNTGTADNQAVAYDITIIQPKVDSDEEYWACIGAYHLTPEENRGKHNLFIEAIDENNNRIFGTAFKWGWEGQGINEPSPDVIDDKPPNELANIVVWANQIIWTGVRDDIPSGQVEKVRTTHPDEAPGNTWGHHSFYVAFKRVEGDETEPPTKPPEEIECKEAIALAESALAKIEKAEIELAAAKKDLEKIVQMGHNSD